MSKTHSQYIKELHILFNQCNISDADKEAIYGSYGVTTSRDLNVIQLSEICNKLHDLLQKDGREPKPKRSKSPIERARTCCKTAIGKLLAAQGKIPATGWSLAEWNLITGTACRAAGVDAFCLIPLSKLRGITYEFNRQAQAIAQSKIIINQ